MNNYGTHKHHKVKAWLARRPRFHVHFTPTSTSWLNLVERFFGDLTQDVVREAILSKIKRAKDALAQQQAKQR